MTLKQWKDNPELQSSLDTQLNSPLWQAVFSVLEELSPLRTHLNIPTYALSGNGDVLAARMIEYRKCMDNILMLSKTTSVSSKPPMEDYGISKTAEPTD